MQRGWYGPRDAICDQMLEEGLNECLASVLLAHLWLLVSLFMVWGCLETRLALPASAALLLVFTASARASTLAQNGAGRAEVMRSRDAHAIMAFYRDPNEDLDTACGRAFREVVAELWPVLAEGERGNFLQTARAVAINGAFMFGAGAAGFLLRPEFSGFIVWLDATTPR